ncbi:MAG: hypothetical protein Q7R83_04360 [bacterium]|nr:hypothetical protein [bacterium]
MTRHTADAIGWVGDGFILLAYGLVSFGVFSATNLIFQLMNIVGSAAILVVTLRHKDYPPAFLNMAWIGITMIALVVSFFRY